MDSLPVINTEQLCVTHWQGRCQRRHSSLAEYRWVWVRCEWTAGQSWPARPQYWASACHSKVTWAAQHRSAAGWRSVLQHWPSWPQGHWRGSGNGGGDAATRCWIGRRKRLQHTHTANKNRHTLNPGWVFGTWFLRPGPQKAGRGCWQLRRRCYRMLSGPRVWSGIDRGCWHPGAGAASDKQLMQPLPSPAGSLCMSSRWWWLVWRAATCWPRQHWSPLTPRMGRLVGRRKIEEWQLSFHPSEKGKLLLQI